MNEAIAAGASAGTLLRRAREQTGTSIAALAAGLKIHPSKLEALEADRHDVLPDPAFARALAQSICRTLKLDPAPVLAGLPRPADQRRLEQVAQGLNTPFMDRPARLAPDDWSRTGTSPLAWLAVLVLAAAAALYFLPSGWATHLPDLARWARPSGAPATLVEPVDAAVPALPVDAGVPTTASIAVPASALDADATRAEPVEAAPPLVGSVAMPSNAASAAAVSVSASPLESLQLHTIAESWIEVSDAQGRSLLSRLVPAGERIEIDGAPPLQVRVGNAAGTELVFRGVPFALAPHTRDNIARFELK
ncbi:MAG: helix-turn-helix domain-containing protein [Burkholderiaceae bacterium]